MAQLSIVFYILAIILTVNQFTTAYVYTIPNATDPEQPGVCYHAQTQTVIVPGMTVKLPGHCETLRCNHDLSINGIGCGLVIPARPPCRNIPQDIDKPFPECCATIAC